jgi:hypothetical protein
MTASSKTAFAHDRAARSSFLTRSPGDLGASLRQRFLTARWVAKKVIQCVFVSIASCRRGNLCVLQQPLDHALHHNVLLRSHEELVVAALHLKQRHIPAAGILQQPLYCLQASSALFTNVATCICSPLSCEKGAGEMLKRGHVVNHKSAHRLKHLLLLSKYG